MRLRRQQQPDDSETRRIFFATDIHGSDTCFRKFINAGKAYSADALILGGDITGKSLVPIEATGPDTWRANYLDHDYPSMNATERQELETYIRRNGQYPIEGTRPELERLTDEQERHEAFRRVVVDSIRSWVELAEERLQGTGIRCIINPGNDDFWEIDPVLESSPTVEYAEGRSVQFDGYELIVTGYSNRTPWDSPRELDEHDLEALLEKMFATVERPERVIGVIHVPPFGTKLDQAPFLDETLKPKVDLAGLRMTSVGSTAVREFIERRQPLLCLHGHVHESKGAVRIGRTWCFNPGSEYTEGVLLGVLVVLRDGEVVQHQFMVG
jgi:uncharacterized protein